MARLWPTAANQLLNDLVLEVILKSNTIINWYFSHSSDALLLLLRVRVCRSSSKHRLQAAAAEGKKCIWWVACSLFDGHRQTLLLIFISVDSLLCLISPKSKLTTILTTKQQCLTFSVAWIPITCKYPFFLLHTTVIQFQLQKCCMSLSEKNPSLKSLNQINLSNKQLWLNF